MIDHKILGIILNNTDLYQEYIKYNNMLIDNDAKRLEGIIGIIYKKHKTINKDLITEHIKDNKDYSEDKFWEIYDSEYDENKYKGFMNELITRKAKRQIIKYANNIMKHKEKNHIDYKKDLMQIRDGIKDIEENEIEDSKKICLQMIQDMHDEKQPEKTLSAISFIDNYQLGYDKSDWIVLGAQESVGKTSKVLSLIVNQLKKGMKIGFVSCEMLKEKIYRLLACCKAGVNCIEYENNTMTNVDKQKLIDAIAWLYEQELYVVDMTREWLDIKKQIKILKNNYNIDMIYIDHLHHIRSDEYRDEYSRLQYISGEMKDNAKSIQIPHFTIAILNDEGKQASEPDLRHVKGNKDIGYDCDIGILMKTKEWAVNGNYSKREVMFYIRKNRNGRIGTFVEQFNCETRNFKGAV